MQKRNLFTVSSPTTKNYRNSSPTFCFLPRLFRWPVLELPDLSPFPDFPEKAANLAGFHRHSCYQAKWHILYAAAPAHPKKSQMPLRPVRSRLKAVPTSTVWRPTRHIIGSFGGDFHIDWLIDLFICLGLTTLSAQ